MKKKISAGFYFAILFLIIPAVVSAQSPFGLLTQFGVQGPNNTALLTWTTNTERATAQNIYVQKSYDAIDFFTIAIIPFKNPGVSTVNNYSYTDNCPKKSGVTPTPTNVFYRLIGSDQNGTLANSAVVTLIISQFPACTGTCPTVIAGPAEMCSTSADYTVVPSATNLTWSVSNTGIATVQNHIGTNIITLTKVTNGVITLTASSKPASVCPVITRTVVVGPPPITAVNITNSICRTSYIEKSFQIGNTVPSETFSWSVLNNQTNVTNPPGSNGANFVGPLTNPTSTVDFMQPGRYTVIVNGSNSCGTTSAGTPINISLPCTGARFGVGLSPNPAQNNVTVSILEANPLVPASGNNNQPYIVKVYTVAGSLVLSKQLPAGQTISNLNTKGLRGGQYLVVVQNGTDVVRQQMLISK